MFMVSSCTPSKSNPMKFIHSNTVLLTLVGENVTKCFSAIMGAKSGWKRPSRAVEATKRTYAIPYWGWGGTSVLNMYAIFPTFSGTLSASFFQIVTIKVKKKKLSYSAIKSNKVKIKVYV